MENAPGLTRSHKTLSILLAVVMATTTLQIPLFVQPSISILRLERNGQNVMGTIVSRGQVFYGFATITGSRVTFAGIFDSHGVPQLGFCWDMAPISGGSPTPLRIPQCGGGGGSFLTAYAAYCNRNTNATACDTETYFDQTDCIVPPYTTACVTTYILHLSSRDALNSGLFFIAATFVIGVVGYTVLPPVGATAGILIGMIGAGFGWLYANDANGDKSMDILVPMDFTNYLNGASGYGLYVATPHFWWELYYNFLPANIGTR